MSCDSLLPVGTTSTSRYNSLYIAATFFSLSSGFAALAHEVLWARRLIDLLGASTESTTRVFACFFLGLCLGAVSANTFLRIVKRPWRAAGLAELGVACFALPALFLSAWADWIWPFLGVERLLGWEGSAIKLVVSWLAVFPAAFCMGMFLPCIAQAILSAQRPLARHGIWLYAANTLGGVLGIAWVTIFGLQWFGPAVSMQLAIAVNLVAAIGCFVLDYWSEVQVQTSPSAVLDPSSVNTQVDGKTRQVYRQAALLSFVSGMGVLTYEMLSLQLISLIAPLSYYVPPAVLAVVVFSLGISALCAPALISKFRSVERFLWWLMAIAAVTVVATPFWTRFVVLYFNVGPRDSLTHFLAHLAFFCMLSLGPAMLVAGVVFPTLTAWISESGDRQGKRWGVLLAANGCGGLIGAEATHRWLLPQFGVFGGFCFVAVIYAAATVCVGQVVQGPKRWPHALRYMPSFVLIALVAFPITELTKLPHTNPGGIRILDEQVGREGVVAVIDSEELGLRIAMANQYVLGGTKLSADQARMGHLPLILHANPQRVACIGLATGITAGAVVQHPEIDSIQIVELSPLVVRAADRFFHPYNNQITRAKNATVIEEDGRTFIAANQSAFDVVISDMFLPWAPGESRLYSLEHFQAVRKSLRPDGLFCQWLAAYQLTPEQLMVLRDTFCQVFPRAYLFRNNFDSHYPGLALVGFESEQRLGIDWNQVRRRCQSAREGNAYRDPILRHAEGVQMLYLGMQDKATTGDSNLNTLSNLKLELSAGQIRLTSNPFQKYLNAERWLEFVDQACLPSMSSSDNRVMALLAQKIAFRELALKEISHFSADDLAALQQLEKSILVDFPPAIVADIVAAPELWPGDAALILSNAK